VTSYPEDSESDWGPAGSAGIPGDVPASTASPAEVEFRLVGGSLMRSRRTIAGAEPAPESLTARRIRLADQTELRQLQVAVSGDRVGYERLDNEILSGIRLQEVATGRRYPLEVSRLFGYEATSADPFALLDPYRGQPLAEVAGQLTHDERRQFQVSLLTGLCWLAAAGIAHRGLGPSAVRWDGQRAQITDFSLSTVTGVPREAVGGSAWAAPEQRPGESTGRVSERDDIWAAGQLIFFVTAQTMLTDDGQLADYGLQDLLAGAFGPPEGRPTAREIMTDRHRLNMACPVPDGLGVSSALRPGHERFWAERRRKHPAVPGQGFPEARADAAPAQPPPGQGTTAGDAAPAPDGQPARRGKGLRMPWRSRS
jgi:hypothetical protein